MKFFAYLRSTLLVATGASALSLSACSTLSHPSSSLPVQSSGSVSSARTFTQGDRLLVTGTVKPPPGITLSHTTHVDVKLLDHQGRTIAQGEQPIKAPHAQSARSQNGRLPYTLSFPADVATRAGSVLVAYHPESHD